MRVLCPDCGLSVKLNEELEIPLHYGPPEDPDGEEYDLPCPASGNEFETEDADNDESIMEDEDPWREEG